MRSISASPQLAVLGAASDADGLLHPRLARRRGSAGVSWVSAAAPAVVVVLAAGRGARFVGPSANGHKLTQAFGRSTVLGTTLFNALESGLGVVVVVAESLLAHVAAVLPASDIVVLPEAGGPVSDARLGMGYSIASGVTACANARAWLVLPADMPMVQPATLRAVESQLQHHPVVYAQHLGQRGHPVGFGSELYSELAGLSGDEGARRLLARYPTYGVEVADPGVLLDLDTPADLERLCAEHARHASAIAIAAR